MNDKAFVYIIWFAISIPLSQMVCRWLWNAVCESAGKNPAAVMDYRAELRGSAFTHRKLYSWLLSNSDNPQKTKKMMSLYQLCTAPAAICLMFAVVGLFTNFFSKFLNIAAFAMIAFIILCGIAGVVYHKNTKNKF